MSDMFPMISRRSVLTFRRSTHLRLASAAGNPDVDRNTPAVGRHDSRSLYREVGRSRRRSDPLAGDPT
jgi:hypothetical protein